MRSKSSIEELAVFGGRPLFSEAVHVGRPNIPDPEQVSARIRDLLGGRWLTNRGPLVQEFERRVADRIGCRHCIAMCNGTVALEIAIRGLGMSGEVIVPSFIFVATVHALTWQHLTPVFCDIDPATHTPDPDHVRRLVTPETGGIIGFHTWGSPRTVEALTAVADDHRLPLLFDAAHAFGGTHRGRAIGNFGRAEVFSFHATKVMNTFEGGAVVTNDDELADRLRLMKNFGFAGKDRVIHLGTNGKMSEASAAMGLESLAELDRFITVNRANLAAYTSGLAGTEGLRFVTGDGDSSNCHYVVVEIDRRRTSISRDQLVRVLEAEGVLARRYFHPGCHRMEPYRSLDLDLCLPNTETVSERVMVLPTGTAVDGYAIDAICALIRLCCRHGEAIARRLGAADADHEQNDRRRAVERPSIRRPPFEP